MDITLLNGQSGQLSPDHRAASYGDGIFETMACVAGEIRDMQAHLNRLQLGANRLQLNWGEPDRNLLERDLHNFASQLTESHVIKVSLLRNSQGRGYSFDDSAQSVDVILLIKPYTKPNWAHKGANIQIAKTVISESVTLAGLKHCNRLDSVLARAEYRADEAEEVWLTTDDGYLIEGSMSNIVLFNGSTWLTPAIKRAGVNGIVRQRLVDQFKVIERDVLVSTLNQYSSAFICNSLLGLVPVLTIDSMPLKHHPDISEFNRRLGFSC